MGLRVLSSEFFSLLGVLVALYALYVEHRKAQDETYEALCDTQSFSCTKVLMSEYGHILSKWGLVKEGSALDVPNPILGLAFYAVVLARAPLGLPRDLVVAASLGSLLFSVYLAWVLYAVLHDFCVVCVSSYVCNAAIFAFEVRAAGKARAAAKAKGA
jgi:vitamin-K-epoxide reductase (warfarin-sensitive)